jgi:hypothetical protein
LNALQQQQQQQQQQLQQLTDKFKVSEKGGNQQSIE